MRHPSQNEIELTKKLVFRFGWNTTCFQIVNPGIERWFVTDAVVGYVCKHKVSVVAGSPVCAVENLQNVIEGFESQAKRVCYFGAEQRIKSHTDANPGYSTVVLGAQPVWSPQSFLERFDQDKSLRAQRNRASNKQVVVSEWNSSEAENHAHLHRVLLEWLATRGLPPMHFLVEPQTLSMMEGRRIFVASVNNTPVGFLVLSPIPARRGWLTEQFVRGTDAPNGTIELMLYSAVSAVAASGDEFVTMGIVPLARLGAFSNSHNPVWLRILLRWARAHGRRFYNFEGLEWFKDKFHPDEWEPIYVVSREAKFSFRTLYAVAEAFTGGSPMWAVLKGVARAIRDEISRKR